MVWLLTFLGFLAIIFLMSLGVIFRNKRIQGSCAGVNKLDGNAECHCKTTSVQTEWDLRQTSKPDSSSKS